MLLDARSLPRLPRRTLLLPRRPLGLVVGGELLILGVGRRQGALEGFMRGLVFVDERLTARRLGLLPRRSLGLVVGGELLILGVGRRQGALGGFMRGPVFVDQRLAARRLGLLPRRSLTRSVDSR